MSKMISYRGTLYREATFGRTNLNPDRFVHDLVVSPKMQTADFQTQTVQTKTPLTWNLDGHNFLDSYIERVDTDYSPPRTFIEHPKYIAWYPMTGELLFSPVWYNHDYLLHEIGDNHPFDDWVRAYLPSGGGFRQNAIVVHFWRPSGLTDYTGDDLTYLFTSGPRALAELLKPLATAVGLSIHVDETPASIVDRYTGRNK